MRHSVPIRGHPGPWQGGVVGGMVGGGAQCQSHATTGQVNGRHPAPSSLQEGYFKQNLVYLYWLECGGHGSGNAGTEGNCLCFFPWVVHHNFLGGKVVIL